MKRLLAPERCLVLLEQGRVTTVRWRNRAWAVKATLDTWAYRGGWWTAPSLEGEARTYHVLATARGEIEVFERLHADPALAGWWVAAWWD